MKTAALFDLDGVIIDTEPSYTDFWTGIGHDYFPEDADFASKLKGNTLTHIFEKFFPDDAERQAAVQQRLADHQRTMTYPLIAGVMEFIRLLRAKGVGVAVVTSSDQEKMAGVYRQHPDFAAAFDRIFTAEDALRSKPAPDCYVAAAAHFGLSAADCVVFEDSFNGLKSGRDSGAYVVGLSTSNTAAEIARMCDEVIPDFREVDVLKHLFE